MGFILVIAEGGALDRAYKDPASISVYGPFDVDDVAHAWGFILTDEFLDSYEIGYCPDTFEVIGGSLDEPSMPRLEETAFWQNRLTEPMDDDMSELSDEEIERLDLIVPDWRQRVETAKAEV